MFQKTGEAVARGIMNFSDVEKWAQGIPVHPRCQSKSCWSKPVGNNCLWIKGLTVTSHVSEIHPHKPSGGAAPRRRTRGPAGFGRRVTPVA